ncbi:putative membrane protein [Actinopolyspora lacussalsi]|nr:putative membrane protein [Actinopolyspora lacussalsi]
MSDNEKQVMVNSLRAYLANLFRGALIGTAEIVPGVSGGTIALVTGIYEALIGSAGHLLSALRLAVADVPRGAGFTRAGAEFRKVRWDVVLPALIGLVCAALIAAKLLEPVIEEHPISSRAVFFGLVLASLWVPISMIGRAWRGADVITAVLAALLAFGLTSLPPTTVSPNPLIVALAAAVAVCALVLPGVSGSFFLLSFGLYETTLSALNERDIGYIATFAVGAIIGLSLFVKLLQWLLEHRRRITLVVMTGIMAGCLRALWPWQTEEHRELLAPSGNVGVTVLFFLLGVALVTAVLVIEHLALRNRPNDDEPTEQISRVG